LLHAKNQEIYWIWAKIRKMKKEIEQLAYKLYELTPEEIKIVEEFGNGIKK